MKRFANDPALSFPCEDTVSDLGDLPDIEQYRRHSGVAPRRPREEKTGYLRTAGAPIVLGLGRTS